VPSLRSLQYAAQPFAWSLWVYARALSPDFRITSVRRSFQEQARLYADFRAGRSALPAAPPGHSMHQYGLAWDMAKVGWRPGQPDSDLAELGSLWTDAGGIWHPSDPVHFEFPY
jgi:hypothetical protein